MPKFREQCTEVEGPGLPRKRCYSMLAKKLIEDLDIYELKLKKANEDLLLIRAEIITMLHSFEEMGD